MQLNSTMRFIGYANPFAYNTLWNILNTTAVDQHFVVLFFNCMVNVTINQNRVVIVILLNQFIFYSKMYLIGSYTYMYMYKYVNQPLYCAYKILHCS